MLRLDFDPKENTIAAEVSGNYGDYCVEISGQDGKILAECDCPYEGYPCKHVAAVLLAYVQRRAEFVQSAVKQKKDFGSLKNNLVGLPPDELVRLILGCAEKYPDFKRELMVRFDADKDVTLTALLKDVERAFPSMEREDYSPTRIAKQLRAILESVAQAPAQLKAEVYWAVVDRILQELNEYGINNESFEKLASKTLDELVKLLKKNVDLQTFKQSVITELMEHYRRDNCGITDDIYDAAHALCSGKSDRQIIIARLKSSAKN